MWQVNLCDLSLMHAIHEHLGVESLVIVRELYESTVTFSCLLHYYGIHSVTL